MELTIEQLKKMVIDAENNGGKITIATTKSTVNSFQAALNNAFKEGFTKTIFPVMYLKGGKATPQDTADKMILKNSIKIISLFIKNLATKDEINLIQIELNNRKQNINPVAAPAVTPVVPAE